MKITVFYEIPSHLRRAAPAASTPGQAVIFFPARLPAASQLSWSSAFCVHRGVEQLSVHVTSARMSKVDDRS